MADRPAVDRLIDACRVPETVPEFQRGAWTMRRVDVGDLRPELAWLLGLDGYRTYTVLHRLTLETMHMEPGEVVMDDSRRELRRHLPILMRARGRVLVSGLGLGCVVRGLLARPDVEHVDVVEIDQAIVEQIGPEFEGNPRVTLHHGDALTYAWPADARWDYAWHDVWSEDEALALVHAKLFRCYRERVKHQGAWAMPRWSRRLAPSLFLDGRRKRA